MAKKVTKKVNSDVIASLELVLDRAAKKAGGDRYANAETGIILYIPQDISRVKDVPKKELVLTVSEDGDDANAFELEKPAKKEGGDKYSNGEITHYIPQSISRVDGVSRPTLYLSVA